MKRFLGFPRPGLLGLAVLLCALAAPATAQAAPAISNSPGSLVFGDQDINTTPQSGQYKTVIVYSMGDAALNIGTISITGSAAFLKVDGMDTCSGTSVPPGNLCTVVVAFDPATVGAHAATLSIPSNAGPTIPVNMSGTGVAAGVFSPSTPSYGYPDVDVFGGAPAAGFFRVTNAGSAAMNFSSVTLTGADAANFSIQSQNCTGAAIAVSAYCDIVVNFDPVSSGAKSANLHFVHDGVGGASDILLTGNGVNAKFSASKSTMNFGIRSVPAGPVEQQVTITNTGNFPLELTYLTIDDGPDAEQFSIVYTAANTCDDGAIAIGASCVLPVSYDPAASGAHSATLRIFHTDPTTSTPGQSTIALVGTGTQATASALPGLVEFESRDVFAGPSPSQTVTVSNTGDEPVTVNSAQITGDNPTEFAITGGTCTVSPPKLLAVGTNCTYTVAFDPADYTGGRSATLTVDHTGMNSPATSGLAGYGVRPEMSPYPGSLAFEQRTVGQGAASPQWIRFENFGTGPLQMNEQVIAGDAAGDYSVFFNDCAGRTLVPTEFCDVAVVFEPRAAGSRDAVLRMTHGPLPATVTDVPLAGSAVDPPALKMTVVNPKKLRLRTTKTITYTIKCPATCTVTANANLLLPGKGKKTKRSTLGWKQITVKGGKTGKLVFKLAGGQRVALANAARAKKKVGVSASFSAWAEGYGEAVATKGFKLK